MRRLLIRVENSKRYPHKLQIQPGTRVSDILRHLKVNEEYVLTLASDPTNPFPHEADVHSLVTDGEHLVARLSQEATEQADASIRNLFSEE